MQIVMNRYFILNPKKIWCRSVLSFSINPKKIWCRSVLSFSTKRKKVLFISKNDVTEPKARLL